MSDVRKSCKTCQFDVNSCDDEGFPICSQCEEYDKYEESDFSRLFRITRGLEKFRETIYELAFGDDAINKDYTDEEVINQIKEMIEDIEYYRELEENVSPYI